MRKIDSYAINQIGIPGLVLMENAGRAVAEEIMRMAPVSGKRWLILAGKGNNGADGLVAARHLMEAGWLPTVVYAADPSTLTGEAAIQRDIAFRLGVRCFRYNGMDSVDWREYDGIVDALLGTGSGGAPRGAYAELITQANRCGLPIVAVDIPSGLDADTGEVYDPCIRAAKTVALAFKKRGLIQFPGAAHAGEVVVRSIGIPARVADEHGINTFELDENVLKARLGVDPAAKRAPDAHKGTYGHVLVAAGSRPMSGAGLLSATAALRGGCGLVSWALPISVAPALTGRQPELMLAGVEDGGSGDWSAVPAQAVLAHASGKQALVIGPGMGRWDGDSAWLREIWEGCASPLVMDADALNMLANAPDFQDWPRRSAPTILTPHPGEMARLAKLSTTDVQRDRIGLARSFAIQNGVTLVLKGARTVCASPTGDVFINVTGNPGMATAGAGDVLAGLIGSLLAQGFSAEQAAAFGVYRHGAAGDRAAAKRPAPGSLIAGDIIAEL
jgi:NAD(P)H-hydrate epimerase